MDEPNERRGVCGLFARPGGALLRWLALLVVGETEGVPTLD